MRRGQLHTTRRFRSILPASILLVSHAAFGEDWAEYTSDNLTLYSDASESNALEVLGNFEQFRHATLTLLGLPDARDSERLLIVAYDRGRDYSRIRPSSNVGGFFYHSVFGPRIVVGPSSDKTEMQVVLFHEYVHYLMNQHSTANFPRWYSEGFAALLSSAEISDSSVVIGRAPPGYSRAISLDFEASVHDVIDTRPDGAAGNFYLTSWLMTHYLLLDAENAPRRRESFLDYLRRYDAGEDPIDAFTASFEMTPAEMRHELEFYGRRRMLTAITLPREPYAGRLSRRVLTEGEALYRLGDIAVERDAYEAAHRYFDAFEERNGASPFGLRVKTRRAVAFVHERRVAEGDALIEPLLTIDISDADVLADIAHFAYDRFVHEREERDARDDAAGAADAAGEADATDAADAAGEADATEATDTAEAHLKRSLEYGARAVEANPTDVEVLYYLGLAYEAAGRIQQAADTLFKSHDINPMAPRLNFALIRVMLKGRRPDVASYLAGRLYSASHSDEMRARLLELQQQIENGSVDPAELEAL